MVLGLGGNTIRRNLEPGRINLESAIFAEDLLSTGHLIKSLKSSLFLFPHVFAFLFKLVNETPSAFGGSMRCNLIAQIGDKHQVHCGQCEEPDSPGHENPQKCTVGQ